MKPFGNGIVIKPKLHNYKLKTRFQENFIISCIVMINSLEVFTLFVTFEDVCRNFAFVLARRITLPSLNAINYMIDGQLN